MATRVAQNRLLREYQLMQKSPTPYIEAIPNEENILEWHYVITGPPDGPYAGGQYHGTLTFPADYPFKPPAIRMITPSGRFQTNTRLCLSMSDYHPKTWNPAWNVSTILTGLLSFMVSNEPTVGSINTTDAQKKQYAAASHRWNAEQNHGFKIHFKSKVLEYKESRANGQASDNVSAPAPVTTQEVNSNTAKVPSTRVTPSQDGQKKNDGQKEVAARQGYSKWQKAMVIAAIAIGWVAVSKLIEIKS